MDIRTKLILALVSVSLVSMVILGLFAYKTSAILFKEVSIRQLEALAESKKANLENLFKSWKTQVRLIGSRTRLRASLLEYQRVRHAEYLTRVSEILEDAMRATNEVKSIALFGKEGEQLLLIGEPLKDDSLIPEEMTDEIIYLGTHSMGPDNVLITFYTALEYHEEHIGWMQVVIKPSDLSSVAGNFTGLGRTGEILIVSKDRNGEAFIVNSPRHKSGAEIWKLGKDNQPADVRAALLGEETHFTSHVRDYRNEDVWSVTRHVEGLGWGLITKVDVKEEKEWVMVLRDNMSDLALALSAFAIVGGTILGIYLARPIQHLASVVHKLRDGNLDVRAEVRGDDEVAFLAASLNQLIEDMNNEESFLKKDTTDA